MIGVPRVPRWDRVRVYLHTAIDYPISDGLCRLDRVLQ